MKCASVSPTAGRRGSSHQITRTVSVRLSLSSEWSRLDLFSSQWQLPFSAGELLRCICTHWLALDLQICLSVCVQRILVRWGGCHCSLIGGNLNHNLHAVIIITRALCAHRSTKVDEEELVRLVHKDDPVPFSWFGKRYAKDKLKCYFFYCYLPANLNIQKLSWRQKWRRLLHSGMAQKGEIILVNK